MLVSYDKVFFKQNSNNYKISALDNIKVAGKDIIRFATLP